MILETIASAFAGHIARHKAGRKKTRSSNIGQVISLWIAFESFREICEASAGCRCSCSWRRCFAFLCCQEYGIMRIKSYPGRFVWSRSGWEHNASSRIPIPLGEERAAGVHTNAPRATTIGADNCLNWLPDCVRFYKEHVLCTYSTPSPFDLE